MNTIHYKFEQIVKQYPNNIAYEDENNQITYEELNNLSNNFAKKILNQYNDVNIFCVFLDQNYINIVTLLALSKAGKTILPLNTMIPLQRLIQILNEYNISALITNNSYKKDLQSQFNGNIIIPELTVNKCDNLNLKISPSFEFIIFNTSGSTGKPKGVIQTHENMLFSFNQYIELYNITPNDIHSLVYPTGFLGGIRDTFVSLLSGAALVKYDKHGDLKMYQWLLKNNITILSLPIKFLRDLYKEVSNKSIKFNQVKVVRPGGDVSYKSDFEKFKKYFPNAKYYILLASSETGIILHNVLNHNSIVNTQTISLGKPINEINIELIHDDQNNDKNVGRLLIKSKYLFNGYINNEKETNKVLTIENGIKTFISNDYVKKINDELYFEGRAESHVKISGARVNPDYIASIASNIVDDAYCMYSKKYKNLYLFYESNENLSELQVKHYLMNNLEFYMVPARCIKLDEIPQKENGKIDRIFIENTITNLINIKKQDKELTELEIKLLNIWKTYLSVDEISVFDNFFDELGGDSLTAQLITTEIENELSVTLTDNIIYEHSTIYDLATELNKRPNHYFKYIKHIIKGDKKLPPIFWATGYPNVIRKDLNYDGDFYYIDSHYNSYATIPSIYDNIEDYCKVRVNEILELIDNKDIILAGYSIGSVYALELSKQLKEKGKNIKFLFLLDPRDSINILNNKIVNKYKYYSQLIFNYIRFIIYYLIWNIQKIFNLKILKRFKYIHSIYAFHRLKYNFNYTNDLTILIQRNNNNSSSKNNFKHLFLHRIYHILNVKKHSDFFNNQSVIKEWMSLFNNYLNSHLN